jgi:leucyl-tRNA synthetase
VFAGRTEKMSKSKKNVVDPQQIISNFGADTARFFMLSDSPPDRDMEWSDAGIDGSWRFLNKLWKFVLNLKNRQEPSIPASDHSISRSGGESDNIKKRAVSAPKLEIICCGSTTFFFDLLIVSVRPANTGLLVSACNKRNRYI